LPLRRRPSAHDGITASAARICAMASLSKIATADFVV